MSTEKPSPDVQQGPKKTKKPEAPSQELPEEKGGFKDQGLQEPTRFGDWEVNGRCSDF